MERIPKAKKLLFHYAEKIAEVNILKEELSIRQRISRRSSQYKVNSYQAVAAKQLERSGVVASAGKNVRYIITNAEADPHFPEKKVLLSDFYDEKRHKYDKAKYIELLKRSFENLLPFEFPELEHLLKSDYNRRSIQKDLLCFNQEL